MKSAINTTHLEGDVSVGRHVSMGGKARVAGSVSIGHNLKVEGWLDAPNIKGVNKGVFPTEEALLKAYPRPKEGWFAGVGISTPFATYVVEDGEWVDSGGEMQINVDMTKYTEDVARLQDDIDEMRADLSSGVVRSREAGEGEGAALHIRGVTLAYVTQEQFEQMGNALASDTIYAITEDEQGDAIGA